LGQHAHGTTVVDPTVAVQEWIHPHSLLVEAVGTVVPRPQFDQEAILRPYSRLVNGMLEQSVIVGGKIVQNIPFTTIAAVLFFVVIVGSRCSILVQQHRPRMHRRGCGSGHFLLVRSYVNAFAPEIENRLF
jgi:hypothetical protein